MTETNELTMLDLILSLDKYNPDEDEVYEFEHYTLIIKKK